MERGRPSATLRCPASLWPSSHVGVRAFNRLDETLSRVAAAGLVHPNRGDELVTRRLRAGAPRAQQTQPLSPQAVISDRPLPHRQARYRGLR